ncbi:MAG: hypothetical protein WCA77_08910 [Thermoplasmata archaeon]
MTSLFRRLRRDKSEKEEEEKPAKGKAVPEAADRQPSGPATSASKSVGSPETKGASASSGPAAVTDVPMRSEPPPALPRGVDAKPNAASAPMNTLRCFICGTEMQGSWCPTCQMSWKD